MLQVPSQAVKIPTGKWSRARAKSLYSKASLLDVLPLVLGLVVLEIFYSVAWIH
jgi:hypothetical protein